MKTRIPRQRRPTVARSAVARWWRQFRQDLRVLARLFPWNVSAVLVVGIALTAVLFEGTYNHTLIPGDVRITYVKAVYAVLNMVAFQVSFADIPSSPALDVYFVIIPLIGIPLLLAFGVNILNILRIFFVRGERGQLWQEALADTVEHPIVVCGLGRVGYRIANQLLDLGQPVIGIDTTTSPLVTALIERDMPFIAGDIHDKDVLHRAGVPRAQTVLVCTNQDLVNIEAVFHIREMNPEARVVLRLFEDSIADEIQNTFDVKAVISRSAVAATAFAHAAIGMEVLETFALNDHTYFLTKLTLEHTSPLIGRPLGATADACDVTVVCLHRAGRMFVEPDEEMALRDGDTLFVFAEMERAGELARKREGNGASAAGPILVCGIRHTGYRVVNALLNLHQPVIALDFEADVLAEHLHERDVPIIYGNFRQHAVLERAGIRAAAALIACSEDDMVNFETLLRARELESRPAGGDAHLRRVPGRAAPARLRHRRRLQHLGDSCPGLRRGGAQRAHRPAGEYQRHTAWRSAKYRTPHRRSQLSPGPRHHRRPHPRGQFDRPAAHPRGRGAHSAGTGVRSRPRRRNRRARIGGEAAGIG